MFVKISKYAKVSNICAITYFGTTCSPLYNLASYQETLLSIKLTCLYSIFCQALDFGKDVRVVFCDITKAFDRVWHAGLLLKLEATGVTGEVVAWFKSYLSN